MKTYGQPMLCWLAALTGLVLALLTEGIGDVIALLLLCAPIVVIGRKALAR